jgi:16S rRNA (adenine1518-N6/adenine1519-N6)-dimethyltransferase
MRPKKSLGQNFLVNHHAAKRIASLLNLVPGETVVEIGGGRGDLTTHLVDTGARVITVEFDRNLSSALSARFAENCSLQVVQSSILEVDPANILAPQMTAKLVGNIPYNLTSPIIEWTLEQRQFFPLVVLMVQREVAQRLAARPGGKDFGSLTVFVQLYYSVRRVFTLGPGSFFPKPKVDSAVVELKRLDKALIADSEYPGLRRLTSACFRWRRKTIVRILREEYGMEQNSVTDMLEALAIMPRSRPEQLAVSDFVALTRKLACTICESP